MVLCTSVLLCLAMGTVPRLISGAPFSLLHPGSMITGLLIGLTVTADLPIYMLVVGTLVAQLPGKLPIRYLGRNPLNPAVLGRSAIAVLEWLDPRSFAADITTSASILAKGAGGLQFPDLQSALLGLTPGAIGETSTIVLDSSRRGDAVLCRPEERGSHRDARHGTVAGVLPAADPGDRRTCTVGPQSSDLPGRWKHPALRSVLRDGSRDDTANSIGRAFCSVQVRRRSAWLAACTPTSQGQRCTASW